MPVQGSTGENIFTYSPNFMGSPALQAYMFHRVRNCRMPGPAKCFPNQSFLFATVFCTFNTLFFWVAIFLRNQPAILPAARRNIFSS